MKIPENLKLNYVIRAYNVIRAQNNDPSYDPDNREVEKAVLDIIINEVRQAMDIIMDNYDFSSVFQTMDRLQWKWRGEVPDISRIRASARDIMELALKGWMDSSKEYYSVSTGGFQASIDSDGISLMFVVADYDEQIFQTT